jgi:4-hydroxythreonine-4-phosphate dehydrogenase
MCLRLSQIPCYSMWVRVGVTLGDPSGIGPEIVAATIAADPDDVVVYGDRGILDAAAKVLGVAPPAHLVEVTSLPWTPGHPDAASGRAQIAYLEAAIADAQAGKLDALVTAPIHKASAKAGGFAFPGHTELLAERFGPPGKPLPVTMMFVGPKMRVSLATIHHRLADVPGTLTVEGLTQTICQTTEAMSRHLGVAQPRIAVAGLNPHAGESGLFGDEEQRIVRPAIEAARLRLPSATVTGPHVPDVVFRDHFDGRYDAVVALYHDQGLIPVKLVDFDLAVNVTLGLPIVRTSPDHGVAHDIAGTGKARATSMAASLRLARRMCDRAVLG